MISTFSNTKTRIPHEHLSIEELINHFVAGTQQLTKEELGLFVDHIVTCKDCRENIGTFIARNKDTDQAEICSSVIVDLFAEILQIIYEIDMQNDICAYIDVLEIQGKEEADLQYPFLVDHMKECEACRTLLEETLSLLHQAKDAGLIASLS